MVIATLRYAYIDEAGTVALSRKSHILVVAALCLENPRLVENTIKKAQKKYGSSLASGELKAKKSEGKLIEFILSAIAKEPIEIFSVIVDRRILEKEILDSEEIYRWAVTRLVRKLVTRYSRIEISLDKRYTKEGLRYKLEKSIREGIADLPQQYVLIRQEDSQPSRELQAVDFIAWALFQKYERGNNIYYGKIADRITKEELITKQTWDAEWK